MIAIGDLHGDLFATHAALKLGGAIDAAGRWVGGPLVVVQTGDELDRGDGERAILDLFDRLASEAKAAGGAIIALNGNHEVMNVQGDFRYVTPRGFTQFQGVSPAAKGAVHTSLAERDRASAFFPGGAYALKLSERDVIAVVKDTVFVHGGVRDAHVRYGIDRINKEARDWMAGNAPLAPVLTGEESPIWTRIYGLDQPSEAACRELDRVLASLSAKRMVVGHTVQRTINSACGGKVFRIDVGMSRYYGGDSIEVLEITDSGAKPLRATRSSLEQAVSQEPAPTP